MSALAVTRLRSRRESPARAQTSPKSTLSVRHHLHPNGRTVLAIADLLHPVDAPAVACRPTRATSSGTTASTGTRRPTPRPSVGSSPRKGRDFRSRSRRACSRPTRRSTGVSPSRGWASRSRTRVTCAAPSPTPARRGAGRFLRALPRLLPLLPAAAERVAGAAGAGRARSPLAAERPKWEAEPLTARARGPVRNLRTP